MTSSLMSHIVSIYKAVTDDVNTILMSTPHVWGGNLLHWPVTRQSRHVCVYLQRQEPFTRLRTLPWLADQRRRHTSTTVWTHACLNTESGKQYKYMQITRRAFCQQNTMTYSLRLVHLAQDMGAAVEPVACAHHVWLIPWHQLNVCLCSSSYTSRSHTNFSTT